MREHLRLPYEGDNVSVGQLTISAEHPAGTCVICDEDD